MPGASEPDYFQRNQNLQLHRLRRDSSRALGDHTGIKKHGCRKHGEEKHCSKRHAVQSTSKAHSNSCGTRAYRCNCGTLFTRRESFTTHQAFCDLAEGRVLPVEPAWKAHSRTCGTQEYRCNCGTSFSRRESFNTHQAFCDLAEERVLPGNPGHRSLGASSFAGGMFVMGAPSSPRGANVGMLWGQVDPLSINAPPRLGMAGNLPGMGIGEGGLSMIPARWGQPGGLGTGPTPPGCGTRSSELTLGGNLQMSTMELTAPLLLQPPKMQQHRLAVSNTMGGSSNVDIPLVPRPWDGMMQIPSPARGSIFANLFSSGNGLLGIQGAGGLGQTGGKMGIVGGMFAGFADCEGGPGAHSLWSTARMTASTSSTNSGASSTPTMPSICNQQQHTSTAQMSVTTLRQNVAQMGASLTNNSLLRSFGMREGSGGGGQGSQGRGGDDNSSIDLDVPVLWSG